jgi:hypothetical protein
MFAGQTVIFLPRVSNGVGGEKKLFNRLSSQLGYGIERKQKHCTT